MIILYGKLQGEMDTYVLVILLCIVNYTHFLIDYNYSYILIVEVEGHGMSPSLAKSTTVMIIDKI